MQENFDIFDFELDSTDMEEISDLDQDEGGRTGPHPDTFDKVPS